MRFKILKNKNLLLLMFGKITSLVGSTMQTFALSLFVLSTTGSATKFASILAVTVIPELILGPFAGVLVDWFDRKKIMVVLDTLSGIIIAGFAIFYIVTDKLPLIYIYIIVISLSLISSFFQPAIQTVIPSIVKKEELVEANSINSLLLSIGNFISPAIAGVLCGIYGLKVIFLINSISFFISAFSELFIKIPKVNKVKENISLHQFSHDFSEGIKFLFSNKGILAVVTLGIILNFALGAITVGNTFISKEVLKVSDFQYGLLESISVVAMMLSSLVTPYLSKKYTVGKGIYNSLFCGSIVVLLFVLVNDIFSTLYSFLLLIFLNSFLVFFLGIANILFGTYFQTIVPLDFMGRVSTVQSTIIMAAMPLSNMVFGLAYDKVSAVIIFPIVSLIMLIPLRLYKSTLVNIKKELSVTE